VNKLDEETAERIRRDCMSGDNEGDHSEADGYLCELLESLGYKKTVEAWRNVGKWYA
jgi:hypothetical protein